jgi:hypothetical protein
MSSLSANALGADAPFASVRPPAWLVFVTALLAFGTLAMAVAETNLWMHYLIDAGESISLIGLAFIFAAGLYLYSTRRLLVSLPLVLPWLLFPVITQGDQIIDNLSITWMRVICHVLLAALFGFPVAVIVMALRYAVRPRQFAHAPAWSTFIPGIPQLLAGRTREGSALLATMLLIAEMWVAVQFLGLLMVITLIVMIWGVLAHGFAKAGTAATPTPDRGRTERFALVALVAGVMLSLALFFGFKNRPGAYQGSPSHFMDPSQRDGGFQLDRVPVPSRAPSVPANANEVQRVLTLYARAFERLLAGYYVLDRNYNYDFHNRLFLRSTPLLANYRTVGLADVHAAIDMRNQADGIALRAEESLPVGEALGALLRDVKDYAAFTFDRAPVLERMSADFEQTQAGLQHATHIFEGEGKMLGVRLAEILTKHRAVLEASSMKPITGEFVSISQAVHDKYANRIVGF